MSQLDTNTITLNNILTKINNLPEKQNLSAVTATASDVLKPKVIIGADGQPITGTIEDLSGQTISGILQGSMHINNVFNFTLPNGYTTNNSKLVITDYQMGLFSGITADQIAEGETVLGITGTHSGGLKTYSGTISNSYYISSNGYGTCTIPNPGFITKYALLKVITYGVIAGSSMRTSIMNLSYDFSKDSSAFAIPYITSSSITSSGVSYTYYKFSGDSTYYKYVSNNTASSLSFYFLKNNSSSTTISLEIEYILIGE